MGLRHRFDDEGADVDLELDGRIAVVTGASKGIGLAVTRALAAEGARVVAGARTTDALEGLDGVVAVPVDLAADDGPALLVQRAVAEHGGVDVLVNNVGAVRLRLDGFLGTSDAEFEWAMRMNFFTALRACRAAIPEMVTRGFVMDESDTLLADGARLLAEVIAQASLEERTDQGLIKEKLRVELRRFIRKRSGRRPFVLPVIMEI